MTATMEGVVRVTWITCKCGKRWSVATVGLESFMHNACLCQRCVDKGIDSGANTNHYRWKEYPGVLLVGDERKGRLGE